MPPQAPAVEDLGPLKVEDLGPIDQKKDASKPQPTTPKNPKPDAFPSAAETRQRFTDLAGGALRGAVSTVQGLASPIRKVTGMAPATPPPTETTTAGKVGRGAEQIAEFFIPETEAEKVVSVLPKMSKAVRVALKAGLTGSGTAAIAAAQGDSRPGIAGAVGAAGPLVEGVGPAVYKSARAGAKSALEKVFGSTPLEPKGVREAIRKMVPTALDEGIPASWNKWAIQTERAADKKGAAVDRVVAGPAGSTMVPIQPVIDHLDKFAHTAAQVMGVTPMSGGHLAQVPVMAKDDVLLRQINVFRNKLKNMPTQNGEVPARVLHDIKSSWNKLAKYGGQKTNVRDLILDAKASAARSATGAIRDVLDQHTPAIADVDKAYHIALDLHKAVIDTALETTGQVEKKVASNVASKLGRNVSVGSLGGAATAGSATYQQTHSVKEAAAAALVGGVTGRMLEQAFQSPGWKALTPIAKNALAEAIASGNAEKVRRIIMPLLASGTAGPKAVGQ